MLKHEIPGRLAQGISYGMISKLKFHCDANSELVQVPAEEQVGRTHIPGGI